MSDEKEPTVIDMRSWRGKKATPERVDAPNPVAPFYGPEVTLTFANEYEFDLWRSGVLAEGRRSMAHFIQQKIAVADAATYDKLVLEVGTIRGGEVENPIALQNAVRRFLGLDEIQAES